MVAGQHRIQRVPGNDRRRHSSIVTVTAVPAVKVKPSKVDMSDVKVETMRGSGPGGQHRNKTESAVRLTHEPTGIVVYEASNRSQHVNMAAAWEELETRLADARSERQAGRINDRRVSQTGDGRRFTHTGWRDETVDRETGRQWRMRDWLKGRWD